MVGISTLPFYHIHALPSLEESYHIHAAKNIANKIVQLHRVNRKGDSAAAAAAAFNVLYRLSGPC